MEIKPWNGTLEALHFGNDCIQLNPDNSTVFGTEDCLFLNIFVPKVCSLTQSSSVKLPVVFYILGGQFAFGSSSFYGPDYIIDTNVILVCLFCMFRSIFIWNQRAPYNFQVTVNYRVGPFGFLTLNMSEYSGNMALKDQAIALKWTYENIERFGGDKEKITLFGHSSGMWEVNGNQLELVN